MKKLLNIVLSVTVGFSCYVVWIKNISTCVSCDIIYFGLPFNQLILSILALVVALILSISYLISQKLQWSKCIVMGISLLSSIAASFLASVQIKTSICWPCLVTDILFYLLFVLLAFDMIKENLLLRQVTNKLIYKIGKHFITILLLVTIVTSPAIMGIAVANILPQVKKLSVISTAMLTDKKEPITPTLEIEQAITNGESMWLLFYSNTCEPCVEMQKTFDQLHPYYKGKIHFIGIDVRDINNLNVVTAWKIKNIPTSIIVDVTGKVSYQKTNVIPVEILTKELNKV